MDKDIEFVKSKIRSIKDFPVKGILFRDIAAAVKDKDALRAMIDYLAEKFQNKGIDYIAAVESRGFIFGSALACRINAGCILIRKPGKLPGRTIQEEYSLEYGTDKLEMQEDAVQKGSKVVIIDDLLATGGTINAAYRLLTKAGADVKAAGFIIELSELKGMENMPEGLEIVSMIKY